MRLTARKTFRRYDQTKTKMCVLSCDLLKAKKLIYLDRLELVRTPRENISTGFVVDGLMVAVSNWVEEGYKAAKE